MASVPQGEHCDAAGCVRLACSAMGTRFELLLHGADSTLLQSVGEACVEEILRLHRILSPFARDSETARVNRLAHIRAVPVGPDFEALLGLCRRMHDLTRGAFDPTIGPLMEAWGMRGRTGSANQVAAARACVSMNLVELEGGRVRFRRAGVRLDFGAIAKGFALDRVREMLLEEGISDAFCHGGRSSIVTIGPRPWRVRIEGGPEIELLDQAMGVSAIDGRTGEVDGHVCGHIIDPRSRMPVQHATMAYAVGASCSRCDAISTAALMESGPHLLDACDLVGVRRADGTWSTLAGQARRQRRTA